MAPRENVSGIWHARQPGCWSVVLLPVHGGLADLADGDAGHDLGRGGEDKTADFWTQGARTLTDRLPGLPQIDLIPAVERYFDLVQQTVDINRRLTIKWAGAAGTLSEKVRDRAESARNLVRDKAESAERTAREQAEQAEKEPAREARFAERRQARQAHDKARERYEGLTKAELSDQLAKRRLPKSGTADELIERLVEADSK
jgi:hypothetical protein